MTTEKFREWMKEMNLTDFSAAVALGYQSAVSISRMANGKVEISVPTEKLCAFLLAEKNASDHS